MSKKIGLFPANDGDLKFYDQNLVIPITNRGEFDWEVDSKKIVMKFENIDFHYENKYKKVISEFKKSSKIFDRHHENFQQSELIYQDLAIQTIRLSEVLETNAIVSVIFLTASSHHIDSLICELACRIAGIEQIFLYVVPMAMNRLIPMKQTDGVITRSNLNICVSSEILTKQIYDFSTFTLSHSDEYSSNFSQNLYFSIWNLLVFSLKKYLYRFLHNVRRIKISVSSPTKNLKPISFYTDLILLLKQRKSNEVLLDYILSDSVQVSSQSRVANLVIFAHFEPEATNYPEGGELHNVIDLIIRIRSLGYTGYIMYKEHFKFKYYTVDSDTLRGGLARSRSFYDNLKSLGCLFVDNNYEPNDLSIVVTLVGTTALERSLCGKYTVVLGPIWYAGLPGTITLESAIELLKTPSLAVNSNTIINDARTFLSNCLNYKTICNPRGIGTGKTSNNADDWQMFYQEMNNLLKILIM
jgi:hypothetical protein